jgi:4-amino-4-deoxy-L-arabinose transferase-like glycosyltransferase
MTIDTIPDRAFLRVRTRFATRLGPFGRFGLPLLALIMLVRLVTLGAYPLVDPSESRYAEMTRKMVETGNWVTPQIDYGRPFWGKPPLSLWLNAIDVEVLGVSEFSVRLSAFLLALGVLWMTRTLAAARPNSHLNLDTDPHQPWVAPTILASMLLFFIMAGSVATDQALVFGLTLALSSFWLALHTCGILHGYLFFIGLAIGLMAKGPVALVLAGLPIGLWVLLRNAWSLTWQRLPWMKGTTLMLALAVPWYLLAEHRTPGFLEYFLVGEHWKRFTEKGWTGDLYGSGRAHPLGTIWLFWLAGALPWSLIFLATLVQAVRQAQVRRLLASADGWRLYCLLWMLAPLLFFSASANLIATYALPALPGCALLLAEWRRDSWLGTSLREGPRLAGIATLVPGVFVLAVIALTAAPGLLIKTQKPLVDQYYRLRESPAERLFYFNELPFSAQFYTAGQAASLPETTDLERRLQNPGRDFLAFPRRRLDALPEALRNHAEPVGLYGNWALLVTQGEAPRGER